MRAVHPGALVHLAISRELGGGDNNTISQRELIHPPVKPGVEAVTGLAPVTPITTLPTTFLEAGEATFNLFKDSEVVGRITD